MCFTSIKLSKLIELFSNKSSSPDPAQKDYRDVLWHCPVSDCTVTNLVANVGLEVIKLNIEHSQKQSSLQNFELTTKYY